MLPDGKKIENLTKDNTAILIAGTINATGKALYWRSNREIKVGNYAIVRNMNGYDLIKVVGIVTTTRSNASKFSNTKYENIKEVVQELLIEDNI